MKDTLGRLLRLRSLLEDVSRLELELRLQKLAQIEARLDHLGKNIKADRSRRFIGIMQSDSTLRAETEALIELATWQQEMLSGEHQKKTAEADAAKAEYLERRKELRQVESVVEARSARNAVARSRAEQRALDDWFSLKSK
jgi:flagellar export protein FliJ